MKFPSCELLITLLVTGCLSSPCQTTVVRDFALPASDRRVVILLVACGATVQDSYQVYITDIQQHPTDLSRGNVFVTDDRFFNPETDVYWDDSNNTITILEGDPSRTFLRDTLVAGQLIRYVTHSK